MFLVSTPVRGHARVDIFGVGGGVRWGNSVLFNFNYIVRSPALPHIRHATLLDVLLHFHTYIMLRCWAFSCTSTHTSCYAAGRSLTFSCTLCLKQNRNFSTKLSGHKITLSLWQNTRFSNFEATLPWNFNSKFTEEK